MDEVPARSFRGGATSFRPGRAMVAPIRTYQEGSDPGAFRTFCSYEKRHLASVAFAHSNMHIRPTAALRRRTTRVYRSRRTSIKETNHENMGNTTTESQDHRSQEIRES